MKPESSEVSRASDGSVADVERTPMSETIGQEPVDEFAAENAETTERVSAGLKAILSSEEIMELKDRCCEYANAGKWWELSKLSSMAGQAGFSFQELRSLMK